MIDVDIKKFNELVLDLVEKIRMSGKKYSSVYGIPQGGVLLAFELSKLLNIPAVINPVEGTLVVDDIVDSGLTIKDYSDYDVAVLYAKESLPFTEKQSYYIAERVDNKTWVHFFWEKNDEDIEQGMTRIIQSLELDLKDPNLTETPQRIARMYKNEFFKHVNDKHEPKITVFPNETNYKNIVLVRDIELSSTCSHHFVPFVGKAHIAYIPGESIVGISKLARIADFYAKRPQLQENLTKQIADYLENKLKPAGIAVVIEAQHMCMTVRGVKKPDATTVTSIMRGAFYDDAKTREEFFQLIRG